MNGAATVIRDTRTRTPFRTQLVALVRRGLSDDRRGALLWGTGLGIASAFEVGLFPSIHDSLGTAVAGYPAGIKDAFGITDLGTIEAYLNAEMFSIVLPFALAYCAMRSVANAIAGAEEQGYLDALLAAPVARRTIVAGAFATAAITAAVVLVIDGALTTVGGVIAGDAVRAGNLAAGLAGVWALAMFFAGCATLAAGLVHRAGQVLGVAAAVLGAMYIFDLVGRLSDAVAPLRWVSAFRYYGAPLQSGLDVAGFIVLAAAGALLAAAGAWCLERRDVTG
ncbi:MAG: beta-exotoxin transport system permease protein [Solirubrobacteraceae bacterium]|nr:beta-exotoxin transport system permease protein [Solirubrobacteraceae bacterium]